MDQVSYIRERAEYLFPNYLVREIVENIMHESRGLLFGTEFFLAPTIIKAQKKFSGIFKRPPDLNTHLGLYLGIYGNKFFLNFDRNPFFRLLPEQNTTLC
jgi:hypothetical protein